MAVKYNQRVRSEVTDLIKAGASDEDILKQTDISSRTLRRWRHDVRYYGAIGGSLNQKPGRPATIQVHIEEAIRDYLLSRPDASYDEVLWFIFDEYNIIISRWTLHRLYKARGWEKDDLRRRALDHAALFRAAWFNTVRDLHTYQCVFVDESASNPSAMHRKYGWSPTASPTEKTDDPESIKRQNRWSVLPAYTIEGYLPGYLCTKEPITQELFVEWFTQNVLPHCTPFPGPRSVVVMDNATIHHAPAIAEMLQANNIRLIYLPPFSPDLNPVEASFTDLKLEVKRRRENYTEHFPDFEAFLRHVIDDHYGLGKDCKRARDHFRKAQIPR